MWPGIFGKCVSGIKTGDTEVRQCNESKNIHFKMIKTPEIRKSYESDVKMCLRTKKNTPEIMKQVKSGAKYCETVGEIHRKKAKEINPGSTTL